MNNSSRSNVPPLRSLSLLGLMQEATEVSCVALLWSFIDLQRNVLPFEKHSVIV